MTPAEARGLVKRLRRHCLVASVSRFALLGLVLVGFLGAIVLDEVDGAGGALWYAAMFAALVWILLTTFSVRQVRASNQATVYMSTGRLDLAEEQLRSALHQFSLYRMGKLFACHNLAVVAHGQRDYQVAAELCVGVISVCGELSRNLVRVCRILLADCQLFLGDSRSAREAIEPLSLQDPRLSLAEQIMLLPIELRCQMAVGDYQASTSSLRQKVRLAELMDSPKAALVHALLAKACAETGDAPVGAFLRSRAELYCDLDELAEEYPIVRDSVRKDVSADNNEGETT